MRILVTGARGQLGAELATALTHHKLAALDRAALDVTNAAQVDEALAQHRPHVVVNCAAYDKVDLAEEEPDRARAVNELGPAHLARATAARGALFVHFSTDYVFGGDRSVPWRESDLPAPKSVYAASKLAGERAVAAVAGRFMVIRTSGLYGHLGRGGKGGHFVDTMLRLAAEKRVIRVVDDQRLGPTFTRDLTDTVVALLDRWAERPSIDLLGTYHVTNSGETSWFGFAREIFRLCGIEAVLEPVSTEVYGARAARPAYSVLANDHLLQLDLDQPRPWQRALADYLRRRPPH